MSARKALLLLAPALLLAACETQLGGPAYPPQPPIAAPPSPGAIAGHGAFRMASGQRVTCAGLSVALMPDLPRYRRRIEELYGTTGRAMATVADVKARSARLAPSPDTQPINSVACDSVGDFAFPSLAPGGYFMIAHVHVRPADPAHNDYVILLPVSVGSGTTSDAVLGP